MDTAPLALAVGVLFVAGAAVQAETATFDTQPEGLLFQTIEDGGITFTNGTWFPDGLPVRFAADDATASFDGLTDLEPFFSPPNVMKVGGATPGPRADYIRVHGWEATRGSPATYAQVDVFWLDDPQWELTDLFLEGLDGEGNVVVSDSALIPGTTREMAHARLIIDGVSFESIRFAAFGGIPMDGTNDLDGFLGHFDNVVISDAAPSPACPCETDGDAAQVDVFDLLAYLDLWFIQDAAADLDDSGTVDVFDLLGFLDCWFPASSGVPCDE